MKCTRKYWYIVILLSFSICSKAYHAITYELNGGRFGDNIATYVRCKWFSWTYDIPLLYKPFKFSDALMMDREEIHFASISKDSFDKIIEVNSAVDMQQEHADSTLFITNFYTKTPDLYRCIVEHEEFGNHIKQMLKPIHSCTAISLPNDAITVAVHVRKGGGFDKPLLSIQQYEFIEKVTANNQYADQTHPLKFPPDQYYINQVSALSNLLENRDMFVFIFTDDKNPRDIVDRYQKAINKKNIVFDCRKNENGRAINIIEDIYGMAQFDCLIRSSSSFAKVAQYIGNHKIIISPTHSQWINNILVIDGVLLTVRKQKTVRYIAMDKATFNDISFIVL